MLEAAEAHRPIIGPGITSMIDGGPASPLSTPSSSGAQLDKYEKKGKFEKGSKQETETELQFSAAQDIVRSTKAAGGKPTRLLLNGPLKFIFTKASTKLSVSEAVCSTL